MEPLTKEQIEAIFQQIDKDNDGFITFEEFTATDYPTSLFMSDPTPLNAFNLDPELKLSKENFTMLAYAGRYNMYPLIMMKIGMQKGLNQYLGASAPAGAPPNIKQSYFKFRAHGNEGKDTPHWVDLSLGVDKDQQISRIKQVAAALGHAPHEVFLMVKFKSAKDGQAVAQKLNGLANMLLQLASGMAPDFEELLKCIKIYSKYGNGYVYLIVQVDNLLVDSFIQFIHKVFESVSSHLAFKAKFRIQSNLSTVLTEDFEYTKAGGQLTAQIDIDQYTLKKIKDVIANTISTQGNPSDFPKLIPLLFEELKVQAEFNNLAEAMSQAMQVNTEQLPKPSIFAAQVKEMGLKEMAEQFSDGGPDLFTLLNDNCQAEGEISLNLHDLFFKVSFDLKKIKDVFELLG